MDNESLQSILANDESPVAGGEVEKVEIAVKEDEPKADPPQEGASAAVTEDSKEPIKELPAEKVRPDIAAIMDERRKRQGLERELAEFRAQKSAEEKPDFFANPEGAVSSRLNEAIAPLSDQIFALKLQLAKTKYSDFDDAVMAFLQQAKDDPVLQHQADTAPNTFDFIYREGKRIKELAPYDGDIDKLVQSRMITMREENEMLKKQLAGLGAEIQSFKNLSKEVSEIPRSLNSVASTSAPKAAEEDDESLGNMFRNKF